MISVHPHIRGAYKITSDTPEIGYGSSPHTWGIRILTHVLQALARFIPTYVGHTGLAGLLMPNLSVHPHIRGAYSNQLTAQQRAAGSSPHTWGILPVGMIYRKLIRFIPTYVGHTASNLGGDSMATVHPHIRGAYSFSTKPLHRGSGSSPHTWGIRIFSPRPKSGQRFIPTYVGHTSKVYRERSVPSVHPHIRGAYPRVS